MSDQPVHKGIANLDDEDDPQIVMLKRLGCYDQHVAVQECAFEYKDWRKCKKEVEAFRKCYEANKNRPHSIEKSSNE